MLTSIRGKSVIVTGGSKGIGRGIARVFAAQGARIMIAARGKEASEAVLAELRGMGATAEFVACDVADWDSVQAMVKATEAAFGGVDILCANAGIFPQAKMIDLDPGEWDRVMATNLKSAFLTVKACIPYFEKAGRGGSSSPRPSPGR